MAATSGLLEVGSTRKAESSPISIAKGPAFWSLRMMPMFLIRFLLIAGCTCCTTPFHVSWKAPNGMIIVDLRSHGAQSWTETERACASLEGHAI